MTSAPQPTTARRFAVFSGEAEVVAHALSAWRNAKTLNKGSDWAYPERNVTLSMALEWSNSPKRDTVKHHLPKCRIAGSNPAALNTTPAWHGAAGEPQTGYHIDPLKHRAGTICSRSSMVERALYKRRAIGSSPIASTTFQNEKLSQQPCLRVATAKQEDVGQSRSGHTQRRHQSQPTPAAPEPALCVNFADSPYFVGANNCTRTSAAVGSESRRGCGQFPPVLALAFEMCEQASRSFELSSSGEMLARVAPFAHREARVSARTQCVGHISCCHAPDGRRTLAAGGTNLVLSIIAQARVHGTVEAGSQTSRPRYGRLIYGRVASSLCCRGNDAISDHRPVAVAGVLPNGIQCW